MLMMPEFQQLKNPCDGAAPAPPRGGRGVPPIPGGGRKLGPHPHPAAMDGFGPKIPSHRGVPAVVPQFLPESESHGGPPSGHLVEDGKMKGLGLLSGPGRGGGVMNKLPGVFTGETHTNFMQKFSELTHSATGGGGGGTTAHGGPGEPTTTVGGGVDSFLSKGKELIFKKFGLGE